MSVFAIADLHLSFGVSKPMNVFKGWHDYEKRIEGNWLSALSPEDTVVLAGDISWGMRLSEAEPDFAFLEKLPGKKVIIKGNHDYWWSTVKKMTDFFDERGFSSFSFLHNNAVICGGMALCGTRGWFFDDPSGDQKVLTREVTRLRTSISEGKKSGYTPVVFLHYPPIYKGSACDEIMDVLREEGIRRCYYGHIHGSGRGSAVSGQYRGIDFTLIAADCVNFCPVKIELQAGDMYL